MKIIDGLINAGQKPSADYRHNEDWMALGKNFAAVFDGATFKGKSAIAKSAFTDASWCAQTAAHIFSSVIQRTTKAEDIYHDICLKLSNEYSRVTHTNPNDLNYGQRPSTTLSCAIQIGQIIRIIQIGDSPIFVKLKNGIVEAFHGDPVLLKHDNAIRDDIKRLWLDNPNSSLKDIMRMRSTPSIRQTMNKAGGYGVLTVVEPLKLNFITKDYNASDIEDVLLFTDGLAEVYDTFPIAHSPEDLFIRAKKPNGLRLLTQTLRQQQFTDKDCRQFPRPKISDDITAIHVKPT